MKNMVKVLAVLLVIASLSGCGSVNSETKETAEKKESESVELTFYGFSDWLDTEPYKSVYSDVKEKFEKENPGYTVSLQSDSWGDWEQKYKTMFASGNPTDVFMVNNPDFPSFANSGNLLDIGEYTEEGYFDDFFPGVLQMYKWRERNMAIPFTTDCRVLWYNKEIFEEAGLDPEKAPATWDEMVQYAQQITDKTGKYGFGMDLGLKEFPIASLYCASGSEIIQVDEKGTITPNVASPEYKKYLKTLVDLKPAFEPDYANLGYHDVAKLFAEGQFGMIISGNMAETDIYEKDFYGQALIPTMEADTPKASFGGGFGIAVSAQTKAPEQAVKFAQMLCSEQFNAELVSDMPASEKGLANSGFAKDEKFTVFMEQIGYAKQTMPKTLYYAELEAAAYDSVVSLLVGEQDIDQVIAELENKIKDIVQE